MAKSPSELWSDWRRTLPHDQQYGPLHALKHIGPDKFVWGQLEEMIIHELNTESEYDYDKFWHDPVIRKEIITKFWTRRGVIVDESV